VAIFGNLFGQIFGDSTADLEARGDQFASVGNWRRAVEEYRRAVQKTARNSLGYRRLAAKLDEARVKSFSSLIEDIHSRLDMREFTYAAEQIASARALAETDEQMARVEECERRMQSSGRHMAGGTKAAGSATPGQAALPAAAASGPVSAPAASLEPARGAAERAAPAGAEAASRPPAASLASDARTPGRDAGADQAFQRLLGNMPAPQVAARVRLGPRYRDAALAFAVGEAQRACDLFIRALDEHPDDPVLLYDLAAALAAAGRTREAQGVYLRLAEGRPEDWQPYYEMAQVLWQDGLRERAVQALEEGLERHPQSGYLMAQWGVLLAKLGQPRAALEKLYQALQLDSFNDAGLYHAIANLHLELGDTEKARRGYLKALELDPHSAGTMLDYAEFLLGHKQDAKAVLAILETAARTLRARPGPRLLQVYRSYLSSRAHMLHGEREDAFLAISRAIEDNDQAWLEDRLEAQRQVVLTV